MPAEDVGWEEPAGEGHRFTDQEIFNSTMNACMRISAKELGDYINARVKELKGLEGAKFLSTYTRFSAALSALGKRTYATKEIQMDFYKNAVENVVKNEKEINKRLDETLGKTGVKNGAKAFKLSMAHLQAVHEANLAKAGQRPKPRQQRKRRRL